ncbi:MAG: hypothetical protein IPI67_11655 [Myxococcales bacterium]|nr:hypothetical protein [Myxococcales bacterium]
MRVAALLWLCAAVACVACTAEPAATAEPECTPNQFRACETDACRGVQQCVDPGRWSHCFCTVLDASYAEASDGTTETGPALDAGDADASVNADATADAAADAGGASDSNPDSD